MIRIFFVILTFVFFSCAKTNSLNNKQNTNTSNKSLNNSNQNFKIIIKRAYGGLKEKKEYLINDEIKLTEIWNQTQLINTPKQEVPKIDFNNKSIVAIFFGEFGSGSFNYDVVDVLLENNILSVHCFLHTPSKYVTTAISNPYIFLEVDKIEKADSIELVYMIE